MEKVRPWCGHPSDRGRLKNRTEQDRTVRLTTVTLSVRHCRAKLTILCDERRAVAKLGPEFGDTQIS